MKSFGGEYGALVIGASGGIGQAFVAHLQLDPNCKTVVSLSRNSNPVIDFANEASIASAAQQLQDMGRFHLIVVATGILHSEQFMPEKKLGDLSYAQMQATFLVNTFGPALLIRHFSKLLHAERSVMAVLSAKVGSISDNRLGGWYSYRASKAALNMLVKTASIEVKRSHPNATLVALHPGTVHSKLSKPFKGETLGQQAEDAAIKMLGVIDRLSSEDTGRFFAHDGQELPW